MQCANPQYVTLLILSVFNTRLLHLRAVYNRSTVLVGFLAVCAVCEV